MPHLNDAAMQLCLDYWLDSYQKQVLGATMWNGMSSRFRAAFQSWILALVHFYMNELNK